MQATRRVSPELPHGRHDCGAGRSIACGQRVRNTQPDGGLARARRIARKQNALRAPPRVEARRRRDQRARIGMHGAANTVAAGPSSMTRPRYMTTTRSHEMAHHRQVMADEQQRQAEVAPQPGEQLHDLRLDRDVERAHRLVGDQEVRLGARARARCRCAGAGRRRTRAESARRMTRSRARPAAADRTRARLAQPSATRPWIARPSAIWAPTRRRGSRLP